MIWFIEGDVFDRSLDLKSRSFALVYADPPYAGCRFKYARLNKSRQWGVSARADFLRELIARMEELRAPDGVAGLSMGTPELRYLHLFPSKHHVCAWVKPYAPHRPGVWPTYAWEPLVLWGRLPNRVEQRSAPRTPHDWIQMSPRVPRHSGHETPKPVLFGEWVLNVALGPRGGDVCELFAGTAPVARAAEAHSLSAVAIDLVIPKTGQTA